jgi:hypothetical protein
MGTSMTCHKGSEFRRPRPQTTMITIEEAAVIADRIGRQAFCILLLCVSQPAHSRSPLPPGHEGRIGQCIRRSANGRIWLERTLWGLRDQESGWIGAEIANSDGSHDLGPLQVNSFWVPRLSAMINRRPAQVRTWLTHDPCFNVQAARWIFLSALAATHDYWKAVGIYHSPTYWRQRRYASLMAAKLTHRFGPSIFPREAADVESQ